MKRFLFLLIVLMLVFSACSTAPSTPPASPTSTPVITTPSPTPPRISWQEADDYVNQFAIVEGTIVLTHYAEDSNGQPTFLNFHDPYEDYFTCVIWGEDRPDFPPHPEEYYLDKRVRVRGLIETYEGSPEMILHEPSQIQAANPDGSWPGFPTYDITTALVTRVIDGDTIEIDGRRDVRYIGIDTPETGNSHGPDECFATEATAKNRELVKGKNVRLVRGLENKDKYDRLLRYVYVDELMVNAELVRLGYVEAYPFPPNVRYMEMFSELEQEAQENDRGLWGECRMGEGD
ncbi:MAG: thermonuclease family protein [Dehalococcoidia bacterium]